MKLTQRIGVLKKIRRHLSLDRRILYYNAIIKQTMMYGSGVWVSTSVDNLNKVFRLQSVPHALFPMLILEQIV